jgi:hypothetical protein
MKLQDFRLQIMNQGFSESKSKIGQRLGSLFAIRILGVCRSSGEEEEEKEEKSQVEEEENFCWVCRAKLTILVALRRMFLLADLLIAAEILYTTNTMFHSCLDR